MWKYKDIEDALWSIGSLIFAGWLNYAHGGNVMAYVNSMGLMNKVLAYLVLITLGLRTFTLSLLLLDRVYVKVKYRWLESLEDVEGEFEISGHRLLFFADYQPLPSPLCCFDYLIRLLSLSRTREVREGRADWKGAWHFRST